VYYIVSMSVFVYILECADTTLYIGSTNNLQKRLKEHNTSKRGAHYTKIRRPVTLVYSEKCSNLSNARRREAEIKSWERGKKLALIKMKKNIRSSVKTVTTFSERVVRAALSIPCGRVTTYGRIAWSAGGGAMSAQSITNILGKAFEQGEMFIPFHRIVYADGHVWLSPKRRKERLELYKKEGIEIDEKGKIKNFRDILFEFD